MELTIPAYVRSILRDLQALAPGSVVAGGFLRDLDNGVEPKDVDIFVPIPNPEAASEFVAVLRQFGHSVVEPKASVREAYGTPSSFKEVGRVVELTGFPLPVQLILTSWPVARITDRFDFANSRITYDGQRVARTVEYSNAKRRRAFTLLRTRRGLDDNAALTVAVNRYGSFLERYPDWRFKSGIAGLALL